MSKYKHIIFDFNGTIINDVELCLELLNDFLREQGKPLCDMKRYKSIFTFPIKTYYTNAGIDFNIESYESLAVRFIEKYQPRSYLCGLYEGAVETFRVLKDRGYKLYILSASEQNNLNDQCSKYNITEYFEAILGISNIEAHGKIDIALNYMKENNIDGDEVLFVGDTIHDYEVSLAIKSDCNLVSCGHQSSDVLKKAGVKIIDSINDLRDIL